MGRQEAARTADQVYRGEDCVLHGEQDRWLLSLRLAAGSPMPEVRVEVWSAISLVNFFSNLEAAATFSVVPLLAFPDVSVERWFRLYSEGGDCAGMALLRMRFEPDAAPPPTEPAEVSLPSSHTTQLAGEPLTQRSESGEEKMSPSPPVASSTSSLLLRPIDVKALSGWASAALMSSLGVAGSAKNPLSEASGAGQGVGSVTVQLRTVSLTSSSEAADGEFFVLVSLDGEELRSRSAAGSAALVFNETFELPALHYRSRLQLTLVEAKSERKVGRASMTVYAVMQRPSIPAEHSLWDLGLKRCVGRVSLSVDFAEDWEGLFLAQHPRSAPPAPDDPLSVETLREHLARMSAAFQLYRAFWAEYRSLMQWEDPLVTGSTLLVFIYACLRIKTEFFLSVPAFMLIAVMAALYLRRVSGAFQRQYIQTAPSSAASTYRPVGRLRVAICGFRNLSSSQVPALIRVLYLPTSLSAAAQSDVSSEKGGYLIAEMQQGARGAIDLTQGLNSIMSSLNILRSETRRDSVLQNHCLPWDDDVSYLYPVLQQLNDKAARDPDAPVLLPWHEHEGCVKVVVYMQSSYSLSSLVDKEPTTGTAMVPLRRLVRDWGEPLVLHREVDEWVPLEWSFNDGETGVDELLNGVVAFGSGKERRAAGVKRPEVRLRMQLDLRDAGPKPSGQSRELSAALVDLFTDAASGGSAFSALWNMRENVQYVQNLLGGALDSFESLKNIFTWADPRKTAVIFAVSLLGWIVASLVPSRWLILTVGMSEFLYAFMPQSKQSTMSIRLNNLLESIPNDADLRDVYAEDRKHHMRHWETERKKALSQLLLRAVEECHWQGVVRTKRERGDWEEVFLVVQSQRMVWFAREDDVTEGVPSEGQLLFCGHAGTTQASPVELREVGDEDILFSVFGRDPLGKPSRKTIVCLSKTDRDRLQSVIEARVACGRNAS